MDDVTSQTASSDQMDDPENFASCFGSNDPRPAHFGPKHDAWWKNGGSAAPYTGTASLDNDSFSSSGDFQNIRVRDTSFLSIRVREENRPRSIDEQIELDVSERFWQDGATAKEAATPSCYFTPKSNVEKKEAKAAQGWKNQVKNWKESFDLKKKREAALLASLDWAEPDRELVWSDKENDWVMFRDVVTRYILTGKDYLVIRENIQLDLGRDLHEKEKMVVSHALGEYWAANELLLVALESQCMTLRTMDPRKDNLLAGKRDQRVAFKNHQTKMGIHATSTGHNNTPKATETKKMERVNDVSSRMRRLSKMAEKWDERYVSSPIYSSGDSAEFPSRPSPPSSQCSDSMNPLANPSVFSPSLSQPVLSCTLPTSPTPRPAYLAGDSEEVAAGTFHSKDSGILPSTQCVDEAQRCSRSSSGDLLFHSAPQQQQQHQQRGNVAPHGLLIFLRQMGCLRSEETYRQWLQQASSRLQNKLGRELTRRETTLLDLQLTWLQDANAASFDTDGSMSRSSSSRSSSRSSVTTSNDLDHPADLCSTLDSSTSPECQSHPTCGIGLHLIDNYVIDPRSSDMDSIETSAASGHEDYMVQYFSCVEDVSRRDQKTDAVSQPEGGSTPGFLSFLSRLFYNNLRSSCGSSPA